MQNLKRKPYAWESGASSPAPGSSGGDARRANGGGQGVKAEDGAEDSKRRRTDEGSAVRTYSSIIANSRDPRTIAVQLVDVLKDRKTMSYGDAYILLESQHPAVDHESVLELLKGLDKVRFNPQNMVYSYIPDLQFRDLAALTSHIRLHSDGYKGLPVRQLREAVEPPLQLHTMLEELEAKGQVHISRMHKQEHEVDRTGSKMRMVFWDDIRERGRAGKRVDEELNSLWNKVEIAETDDVAKLLTDHELSASAGVPVAAKPAAPPQKKKKRTRGVLKITNTHMKAQGIDFSQDYEAA